MVDLLVLVVDQMALQVQEVFALQLLTLSSAPQDLTCSIPVKLKADLRTHVCYNLGRGTCKEFLRCSAQSQCQAATSWINRRCFVLIPELLA